MKQLSDGTVSAMNIAFLLCLDVARFHSCVTYTVMHFRKETKQFWEVVYRICKGKGLRLFSGSKNMGSVQNKLACRGNYFPKDSSVNFVVPGEKSLVKNSCNLSKVILPGIMDSAIKLLDKSKKYVLSIDGKKIASGLGKNNTGYLWGHKTPNLEEALKKRDEDLSLVSKIEANIDDNSQNEGIKLLPKLLTTMSQYLATTRNMEI